jgi:hypothetical protein
MRWTTWLWVHLLLSADRLWGTRFVTWELERRQRRIERLTAVIAAVNQDLAERAQELAFYRLIVCLLELKSRSECGEMGDWLHFVPQSEPETSLFESVVDCLVKPRLAQVDTERLGPGCFAYRLHPDWPAIIAHLSARPVAPELTRWLADQTSDTQGVGER